MHDKEYIIWWVRSDFRFLDNRALFNCIKEFKRTGKEFLPVAFIDKELLEDDWMNIGYSRRQLLSQILSQFAAKFDKFLIVVGDVSSSWQILSKNFELNVFVNDDCEPYAVKRFREVGEILAKNNGRLTINADYLTANPEARSQEGNLYSVFTPFMRQVTEGFVTKPALPRPDMNEVRFVNPLEWEFLDKLDGFLVTGSDYKAFGNNSKIKAGNNLQQVLWNLIDRPNILHFGSKKEWDKNPASKNHHPTHSLNIDELVGRPDLTGYYTIEEAALQALDNFNQKGINEYQTNRNFLGIEGTSNLSLALKWGLVSSRTINQELQKRHGRIDHNPNLTGFVNELIWRDFYRYLLKHYPELLNQEFQPKFRNMIWVDSDEGVNRFTKWIQGRTGYPAVDAAMNQIARTGWMHNRARMMVASILTKNLGIDWRWGQDYFRLMLVDLDEASNNGGWQWSASVGADPKPIRIFNPYTQATNWDKEGLYQKKWLPEDYYTSFPIVSEELFTKIYPKGQTTGSLFDQPYNNSANSRNVTMNQIFTNRNWQSLLDLIVPYIEHKDARNQALIRYGLEQKIKDDEVRDY